MVEMQGSYIYKYKYMHLELILHIAPVGLMYQTYTYLIRNVSHNGCFLSPFSALRWALLARSLATFHDDLDAVNRQSMVRIIHTELV